MALRREVEQHMYPMGYDEDRRRYAALVTTRAAADPEVVQNGTIDGAPVDARVCPQFLNSSIGGRGWFSFIGVGSTARCVSVSEASGCGLAMSALRSSRPSSVSTSRVPRTQR